MGVAFYKGQTLGEEDLNIYLESSAGNYPVNAQEISYAVYDYTTKTEVLLGAPIRTPSNPAVGHYYAPLIIPLDANLGGYRIRWTFRERVGGPVNTVVQEFEVIDKVTLQAQPTNCHADLFRRLRIMLRDAHPDRNYSFRPPAHEETVNQFNQVFGHIWLDEELEEFLIQAMDEIAMNPPATPWTSMTMMLTQFPHWRSLLITGGMMHALQAAQINWIAEEFGGYSIGGISLDLDKSSRYESAYNAVHEHWLSQIEAAKRTVKITRGLQQPKYGMGIRSAFGPHVGAGVLSPRKFVGW